MANVSSMALQGLKVLDLTQGLSGPLGTKYLADYGADVIKIERPRVGDPARMTPPFLGDDPHLEKSGLFLFLNTNKRGLTLNLKHQLGNSIFLELAKSADLVVESYKPGTMDAFGLSYDELSKENPALSLVALSNFGQTGPYRDYELTELVSFALAGPMYQTGAADREPLKFAEATTLGFAGLTLVNACMSAAISAQFTGRGRHVDLSIAESFIPTGARHPMAYFYTGDVPQRPSEPIRAQFLIGSFPCKDGYIAVQGTGRGESWWPRVFKMIGQPELAKDPRFKDSVAIMENGDDFDAVWYSWLMNHTRKEIFDAAGEARYPIAPVYTAGDIFADPHFNERGIFSLIDHQITGPLNYPSKPFRLHGSLVRADRPAPLLGQHNSEIFSGAIGLSTKDLSNLGELGVV